MKVLQRWLIIILEIIITLNINAQNFCMTDSDSPDLLQGISQYQTVENTYTIGIFFHVIRKSNGTGGQTQAEVSTALNILNSDYANHGINFSLLGIDEINDDATYNRTNFFSDNNGDGKFDNFSPNSHPEAIDIYLFANDKLNSGLASGIPGTALVIGGSNNGIPLPSSHVLSHEIGHCLGLYHTFHGICEGGCAELVNGSNSATCGDFVTDTPADPKGVVSYVNYNTCIWNGVTCTGLTTDANGQPYNPDNHLIMAYVPPSCMQYHTSGQGDCQSFGDFVTTLSYLPLSFQQ